jgi:hypothetical protein
MLACGLEDMMRLAPCGRSSLAALLVVAALSSARPGRAQSSADSAAAQTLFDRAKSLMAAGRAADACPKFEESQRLDPGVGTLLNLARCYEQTGRFASAWGKYLEAASAAKAKGDADREQKARDLAASVLPRVSKLVIEVAPEARTPELVITRDGAVIGEPQWGVPIPADGGPHKVAARAPGKLSFSTTVVVAQDGSTATVSVATLKDAPATPSPASTPTGAPDADTSSHGGLGVQRIVAIGSGVIGVAGITLGTVFGLKSKSKHDDAAKDCHGSECTTQAGLDASNDAQSAGNVATVAFIVGGVALAGGVALWFTAPSGKSSTQVGLGLGSIRVKTVF